jgi:hypothetical protein
MQCLIVIVLRMGILSPDFVDFPQRLVDCSDELWSGLSTAKKTKRLQTC